MLPFEQMLGGLGSLYFKAYMWLEMIKLILICICLGLGASLLFVQLPNYFDARIRYYQTKTLELMRGDKK